MTEYREAFIGIDVAKLRNAVAIADAGRDGEIRYLGEIDDSPESMRRLLAKLLGRRGNGTEDDADGPERLSAANGHSPMSHPR